MGLTGLGLAVFVFAHMAGNLLIFAGPKAYNLYAHALVENPFLVVFELGLLALFFAHIVVAVVLSLKSFKLKKSHFSAQGPKATPLYQKTLLAQGALVLVFVIFHLITFKYGNYYKVTYGDQTVRDLFALVVEVFQNPLAVIWYLVALLILGVHLFHGLKSSFQSLGLSSKNFDIWVKKINLFYALIVTSGYVSLPLYVHFFVEKGGGG